MKAVIRHAVRAVPALIGRKRLLPMASKIRLCNRKGSGDAGEANDGCSTGCIGIDCDMAIRYGAGKSGCC